ncbi:MAG: response regulator, partial [Lacunisphaera sp.]
YGIVQQHGGSIAVRSTPGVGTTFEILLPMESTDAVPVIGDRPRVVPSGWGMVLLAEDDPQVQSLARQILTRNGYEVVTAADGELAVALLDQHHAKLRLVILDVLMPKLSGRGVYDYLKSHYPQIPVLFCSGYNADMLPAEIAPATGLAYLNKPYSPVALLEAVHGLLDRTP